MTDVRGQRSDVSKSTALSPLFVALCLSGALLVVVCVSSQAQQVKTVHRIGFLTATSLSAVSARIEALRHGLRELGYVEGKNIAIEYRFADGKLDRVPGLAAELMRLRMDIIITGGPIPTR